MEDWQTGILGFIFLFVFMLLRMHIGVAMGIVAFVGIAFLNSLQSAFGILADTAFANSSSYVLSIIPMFMLMGELANISGVIQGPPLVLHPSQLWAPIEIPKRFASFKAH